MLETQMHRPFLITIDIDWAPDFAIEFVADRLVDKRVRATWFVTHSSPAVERLRRYPELFELGIHPNFLPGSSHGETPADVLRHCMELVPEATSMRSHALVQSTPILARVLDETPVRFDASLFLPRAKSARPIEYHWGSEILMRVPYVWEDDLEMERPDPSWTLEAVVENASEVLVLDFHPIHVYLNSSTMRPYRELQARSSGLRLARRLDADVLVAEGLGTRTAFYRAIEIVAEGGETVPSYGQRCRSDIDTPVSGPEGKCE